MLISGLFQNDATEFALSTYMEILDMAAKGEIDESVIATSKWSRARETVLAQQSSNQMLGYLVSTIAGGRSLDYLDKIPQFLAGVNKSSISASLAPCLGHETITVMGPLEYAEPAVKALGLPYEVIDWDELHQAQLNEKERAKHLKKKAKYLSKKAKEEAKKAAEEKTQAEEG